MPKPDYDTIAAIVACLCTCTVVTGGNLAKNPNCPLHGNIEQKCESSRAGNRLETHG